MLGGGSVAFEGIVIGSPVPHDSGEAGGTGLPQSQSSLSSKRQDVFVI